MLIPITRFPLSKVEAPSNITHSINNGLVVLSWNRQCCNSDLLGYVIEYRRLGKAPETNEPVKTSTVKIPSDRPLVKRSFYGTYAYLKKILIFFCISFLINQSNAKFDGWT